MILVSIDVIFTVIIPQNQIVFGVDLAVLMYMVVITILITHGNILKIIYYWESYYHGMIVN